ncbi:hypothetical protein KR018_006137 [Drosophila ironensis]|nr:hypothetical protein KR018_006137 [Drosophila ironensis]
MVDITRMCRACMDQASEMLDIRATQSYNDPLAEYLRKLGQPEVTPADLIAEICDLAVQETDHGPQKVCEQCVRRLRSALLFRRQYLHNQTHLKAVKVEEFEREIYDLLEEEEWDRICDKIDPDEVKLEDTMVQVKEPKVLMKKARVLVKKTKVPVVETKFQFECPHCPRTFPKKRSLTLHSRTHKKRSK